MRFSHLSFDRGQLEEPIDGAATFYKVKQLSETIYIRHQISKALLARQ
jgi:hypothetical protein